MDVGCSEVSVSGSGKVPRVRRCSKSYARDVFGPEEVVEEVADVVEGSNLGGIEDYCIGVVGERVGRLMWCCGGGK